MTGNRVAQRLQRAWLKRGAFAVSLLPLAWLFGGVTAIRRVLYRLGLLKTDRLAVPVVVVGNLIAGGAGKTPTVMAVVGLLRRHGFTPGIVSRGHGRNGDSVRSVEPDGDVTDTGDEPLLLRLRTGAPVFVGRDRAAAGRELLRRHPRVDIIVSDDGLQHLAMARSAQVLVFDERGVGNGWLLPAGPLREYLPASVPGRSVVLYNAPAASTRLPGSMVKRSLNFVAELAAWRGGEAATTDLASLRGRPILAAAGLAHPERFFAMLRSAGLSIVAMPLPDHFDYAALPWPARTGEVVVTEKDAVKLDPSRLAGTRVWVATLDFFLGADFDAALLQLLAAPARYAASVALIPRTGSDDGNPTP